MNAAITHIGDARESLLDQNFQAGVESDEERTCILTSVQVPTNQINNSDNALTPEDR